MAGRRVRRGPTPALPLVRLAVVALAMLGCEAALPSAEPIVTEPPATLAPAPPSGEGIELVVFAAASLRDVVAAAKPIYEADHPGITLTVAADSSAALRTQIEQGAEADVFLSADESNPGRLVEANLAAGTAVAFATNALALVVPSSNPGGLETPADLAEPGLAIIAAGEDVPISLYAEQLLGGLATVPGYPADFVAAYRANVVSHEDSVRAVLTKLELAEGDAGFVYVTDAIASTGVRVIPLPDGVNVTATYAGVVVANSRNLPAARQFFDWMTGPDGGAVLARFGFGPPP